MVSPSVCPLAGDAILRRPVRRRGILDEDRVVRCFGLIISSRNPTGDLVKWLEAILIKVLIPQNGRWFERKSFQHGDSEGNAGFR